MSDPINGLFRDPKGNVMNLGSTTPEGFRVLVTRKLEAGWSYCKESPAVKPLIDEYRLALPPAYEEISVTAAESEALGPAVLPLLTADRAPLAFTVALPGLTPTDEDE